MRGALEVALKGSEMGRKGVVTTLATNRAWTTNMPIRVEIPAINGVNSSELDLNLRTRIKLLGKEPPVGELILLSMIMAIFGSTFYTTNSLAKQDTDEKRNSGWFDEGWFWGGFLFQLGEAVVFSLFLFLLICVNDILFQYIVWLPLFSLILGMNVKSGEKFIFGFSDRLIAAAEQLLPTNLKAPEAKPPNRPRKLTPPESTSDIGKEVSLSWQQPAGGPSFDVYRVYEAKAEKEKGEKIAEIPRGTEAFKVPGKKKAGTFYYYVVAVEDGHESPKSNVIKAIWQKPA